MDTINRKAGLPVELADALADVLREHYGDDKPDADWSREAGEFVMDLTRRGYIIDGPHKG
jgi:hypothetical protein